MVQDSLLPEPDEGRKQGFYFWLVRWRSTFVSELICTLQGCQVLHSIPNQYSGVLRTGSRKGPSLRYCFVNNSTCVIWSPPLLVWPHSILDHVIYCLRNWVTKHICWKAVIVQISNGFHTCTQKRSSGDLICHSCGRDFILPPLKKMCNSN